jgi:hypothetical protein
MDEGKWPHYLGPEMDFTRKARWVLDGVENEGKVALIHRALYGGRSAGRASEIT